MPKISPPCSWYVHNSVKRSLETLTYKSMPRPLETHLFVFIVSFKRECNCSDVQVFVDHTTHELVRNPTQVSFHRNQTAIPATSPSTEPRLADRQPIRISVQFSPEGKTRVLPAINWQIEQVFENQFRGRWRRVTTKSSFCAYPHRSVRVQIFFLAVDHPIIRYTTTLGDHSFLHGEDKQTYL